MSVWGDDLDRRDAEEEAAREAHNDGEQKLTPCADLVQRMMALRNNAIAGGMRLLTVDEILAQMKERN